MMHGSIRGAPPVSSAALFQFAATGVAAVLLIFPLRKWGSILIDRLLVSGA